MPSESRNKGRKASRQSGNGRAGSSAAATPEAKPNSDEFERTREAIVRAAAEVFCRDGFRAGTTKDIAAKVGLSQPSLYYYIGSKETLLAELAMRLDHDMAATWDRTVQYADDPVEQLKVLIRELTKAIIADTTLFAVYWAESRWLPEEVAAKVSSDEKGMTREIEKLVARVQAEGALPEGPAHIVTEGILGMMLWMYRWHKGGSHAPKPDAVADVFLRMLGLED
jgi:AcrR family transcriptional regulator